MTTGNKASSSLYRIFPFLFAILAFISQKGLSQHTKPTVATQAVKTYRSHSYYEEDGLASNMVYEMAQASDGLLWFVTQKGISTFDGLRWETFDRNIEFLPTSAKLKLLPTREGGMLVAGNASHKFYLSYFLDKKWQELPMPPESDTFSNLKQWNLATIEYEPNQFYVGLIYKKQLYFFNSATNAWQTHTLPSPTEGWQGVSHISFFQNQLYIFSRTGLSIFQPESKTFQQDLFPALNDQLILSSAPSPDRKELYLLGDNFVGRIREGNYETLIDRLYQEKPGFIGHYTIVADHHNRLFFHHNAALYKFNLQTGSLDPFKLNQPKSSKIPTKIFEDREGDIWFCSMRGVDKVNSFRFHSLNKESGLVSNEISTILPVSANSFLLGGNSGYSILHETKITNYPVSLSNYNASYTRILDAVKAPEGTTYLAGTSLGVGVLGRDNQVQWFSHPENEIINTVAFHQGKLLAGTFSGKILSFKNGIFKELWRKESPLYIRKIISDDQQLILLTNAGVYHYGEDSLQISRGSSFNSDNVYSLFEWRGRTFAGTIAGLCELVNDSIVKLSKPSLRINRPVYAMLEDSQGRLWAGTDKGVYIHDKGHFINYNLFHGLAGKEVNRHAFELMPNGEVWIGTDQGVSVYQPEDDFAHSILPDIRITGMQVAGEPRLLEPEAIRLKHDKNTLEVFFQTITFNNPTELSFRYKLAGLEKEWMYSDNHLRKSVRYTNLPPGEYRFVVQARIADNPWSKAAESKPITILTPYYQRWWFILLLLFIISAAGYTLHAFLMHKRNAKKLQKAIEEKRKEIDKSERRFKAVWEATDTGIALIDKRGKVLMANPSLCIILQAEPTACTGTSLFSLLPTPLFSEASIHTMYTHRKVVRKNLTVTLHGDPIYLSVTLTFADNLIPGESLMVVGCKDVTNQKLTEASNIRLSEELLRQNMSLVKKEEELANYNYELLQHRQELEQALQAVEERNYELDQFVYKTSHDLRAPIASAMGLLNIIQLEKDPRRLPEYLGLIESSLQKQDTFIKAMLSFSKSTRVKNKAEGVDLKYLIEKCLKDLEHLPGFKEVHLQVEVQQMEEPFYSDKMKLYIILSNMISNSIKYRNPHVSSFLFIRVEPAETGIALHIEDNGIGIPQENLSCIFDMFYRGTELSDGSGLGLYIVKQTVEKLRGHITVKSTLGEGCYFTVTIPKQQVLNGSKKQLLKLEDPDKDTLSW